MFGKQLTDKEKIDVYARRINNLLPDYKEGDILYQYSGGKEQKVKFLHFSHDGEGNVVCVLDPLLPETPNASYDFFSAFSYPLDKVYKKSAIQE